MFDFDLSPRTFELHQPCVQWSANTLQGRYNELCRRFHMELYDGRVLYLPWATVNERRYVYDEHALNTCDIFNSKSVIRYTTHQQCHNAVASNHDFWSKNITCLPFTFRTQYTKECEELDVDGCWKRGGNGCYIWDVSDRNKHYMLTACIYTAANQHNRRRKNSLWLWLWWRNRPLYTQGICVCS